MNEKNIAIYLDFENLVLSAEEVYPSKTKPLLLGPLVDYIASKGNICVKKAYADWSKHIFSRYQKSLIGFGFEMIHLPATTSQGKNGADVRLAIDAIENMASFEILDTFVIGSGDTDFISLIQNIRARGKSVIVLGFEHSVGGLIKTSSSEFKSLDELLGTPEKESLSSDLIQEVEGSYGRDLMIRYVKNRDNDDPIQMSKLKLDLLRLDPSFSEKKLGFSTFKKYVESLSGDVVDKIDPSRDSGLPIVFFKEVQTPQKKKTNTRDEAKRFLQKNLKYMRKSPKRTELTRLLFKVFQDRKEISMHDLSEEVFHKTNGLPRITIRKYINTLFADKAFIFAKEDTVESLLDRPLKLNQRIKNPETLEQIYMSRIVEIITNRFPDLKEKTDIQKILK
ncbi:NYN domain-containing protein [bacterium]|nr:NYN domain-containing protein [bacterium]